MQKQIVEEMKVKVSIDPLSEIQRRVDFIKSTLTQSGCKSLILGISGGVDSTTCGRLAQIAVNELNKESNSAEYQFIAVRLPYGIQKDEDEAHVHHRAHSGGGKKVAHKIEFVKPGDIGARGFAPRAERGIDDFLEQFGGEAIVNAFAHRIGQRCARDLQAEVECDGGQHPDGQDPQG